MNLVDLLKLHDEQRKGLLGDQDPTDPQYAPQLPSAMTGAPSARLLGTPETLPDAPPAAAEPSELGQRFARLMGRDDYQPTEGVGPQAPAENPFASQYAPPAAPAADQKPAPVAVLKPPADRASRVSEALYAAFTRQPLKDDFFKRTDPSAMLSKAAMDPFAAAKFQLELDKFGHRKDKDAADGVRADRGVTVREGQLDETKNYHGQSLEQRGAQFQDNLRERRNRLAVEIARAQAVDARALDTGLENFAKGIKDDVPIIQALKTLDEVAPGLIEGLPDEATKDSLGFLTKVSNDPKILQNIGTNWTDEKTLKVRATSELIKNLFAHKMWGSALSGVENANKQKLFMDALGGSPAAQAIAIDALRRMEFGTLRNAEAATRVPRNHLEEYARKGGVSTRMDMFKDLLPADDDAPGLDDTDPLAIVANPDLSPEEKLRILSGGQTAAAAPPALPPAATAAPRPAPRPTPKHQQPPPEGGSGPLTKKYSPSKKLTYIFDASGSVVGYEEGDTRGTK